MLWLLYLYELVSIEIIIISIVINVSSNYQFAKKTACNIKKYIMHGLRGI